MSTDNTNNKTTASPELPKNTQFASLTLHDPLTGEASAYERGTLVQNICAAAADRKSKGCLTVTLECFKGDVMEYFVRYQNKRPISQSKVNTIVKERNAGVYVDDYPNFKIDWDGNPINGGHSALSCLKAESNCFRLCFVLGVDPRMSTREDVLKSRGPAQQSYYIEQLEHQIQDGQERTNFVAACKSIWLYIHETDREFDKLYNPTEAAHKICQTEGGQEFLCKAQPYFLQLTKILSENEANQFKKAKFYIPALMLCLTGEKEMEKWAVALASGTGLKPGDSLTKCRNLLSTFCNQMSTSSRDSRPVRDDVERVLAMLHAKANKKTVPLHLIPYREYLPGGAWRSREITKEQESEDNARRKEIVSFFIDKIKTKL